jgi:hypothetical protein
VDDPIIAQSALKHGLTDEEIPHAYRNPVRAWDVGDGFTMIIGANQAALNLEVGDIQGNDGRGHRPRHAGPREILKVISMPRTVDEILAHADELAARFEDYEPNESDELNIDAVAQLRDAVAKQSDAERHLLDAVKSARDAGMSWNAIGAFVGTTGEAARQRYGSRVA